MTTDFTQPHDAVVAAPAHGPVARHAAPVAVTKQSAWGLWWLCGLTFGIYYLIWYGRINRELSAVLGTPVPANGKGWAPLIPVLNIIGLYSTAKRLNAAHTAVGSQTQVSTFVAWFLAPMWFASQTRYLQRRMNTLHDAIASR